MDSKEIKPVNPKYILEGLMLKLKLQYFGHLMQRADTMEKTPMVGKIEANTRRGQQITRGLEGITDSMNMSLGKLWANTSGVLAHTVGKERIQAMFHL